ncbi:MAG: hypothetical protein PHW60_01160, partial [Kiritimatiellae bacterium]|nr:hypothetical protein [Kiritimatiellia bacterium]
AGTIKDLSSDARLNLIIRMQTEMALGLGKFIQSQDPAALDAAYKDYRIEKVVKYLRAQQLAEPYLFLVIGPKPYYDCATKDYYDPATVWQYNVQTCEKINQQKSAALMLAGGGGGTRELWGTEVSDDLTKTTWRK